jgi:L-threonylcarbamoyladenylate synthase
MILRPGGVTFESLQKYIPDLHVFAKEASVEAKAQMDASPSTPGMKYRHYSPKAGVVLLVGNDLANMRRIVEEKFVCSPSSSFLLYSRDCYLFISLFIYLFVYLFVDCNHSHS